MQIAMPGGAVLLDPFVVVFFLVQSAYLCTLTVNLYFLTRPRNMVQAEALEAVAEDDYPYIVLFYPVLREAEATMRTTFLTLDRIDYPKSRYRVVAIPNADDVETIASLDRLKARFGFLQVLRVPPTSHPSWGPVWENWDRTEKAYWWHRGPRAHNRNLPPKKTRQLIYAFYNIAESLRPHGDFLVNYIDADSCPPADHFKAAAAGIKHYDVLQAQNVAGNCTASLAASWHAFDHMAWDGYLYPHMSANGRHPYWVLGKGLFFKASDLVALGGFHPWITIEDPEVGMRFWTNGKRLGVIETPLVEEVPSTFSHGITQRKRWVAGFFQSLASPLKDMGMKPVDRFKARLNFVPCLSLWLNAVGWPMGAYVTVAFANGVRLVPDAALVLGALNAFVFLFIQTGVYVNVWRWSRRVLPGRRERLWYLFRVNPVFILAWWFFWLIPLAIGFRMFLLDQGLIWERTEKSDANHALVRRQLGVRPRPEPVEAEEAEAVVIPFPRSAPAKESKGVLNA